MIHVYQDGGEKLGETKMLQRLRLPVVLVLEDDPLVAASLTRGMECQVDVADGIEIGLELARINDPAVIVVDNMLVDGRGIEALAALRDAAPSAVILLVSGELSVAEKQQAERDGALVALEKDQILTIRTLIEVAITVSVARPRQRLQ